MIPITNSFLDVAYYLDTITFFHLILRYSYTVLEVATSSLTSSVRLLDLEVILNHDR